MGRFSLYNTNIDFLRWRRLAMIWSVTVLLIAVGSLLVRGMSCAACVRRLEQALTGLEGVSRAEINLATEKATIEYDAQLVSPEKISAKITEVGYQTLDLEPVLDGALAKTTLLLGGMTCAACVRRVEAALSRTSCPSASAARPCRRGSRKSAPRAIRERCGSATFSTMERRSMSPSVRRSRGT